MRFDLLSLFLKKSIEKYQNQLNDILQEQDEFIINFNKANDRKFLFKQRRLTRHNFSDGGLFFDSTYNRDQHFILKTKSDNLEKHIDKLKDFETCIKEAYEIAEILDNSFTVYLDSKDLEILFAGPSFKIV